MSLTCGYLPIMAAKHTLIWAKIAVVEPIILYETAKIRATTTVARRHCPSIWDMYGGI